MDEPEISAQRLEAAEEFLHQRIPLTRAMGVRVLSYDGAGFVTEAPVALNSNHLGTAFGGSINAVATLAAYGLLWMESQQHTVDIVIRESSIRFLHPVRSVIRARCPLPPAEAMRAFSERLRSHDRARIELSVVVEEANRVVAELKGIFVAIRRRK